MQGKVVCIVRNSRKGILALLVPCQSAGLLLSTVKPGPITVGYTKQVSSVTGTYSVHDDRAKVTSSDSLSHCGKACKFNSVQPGIPCSSWRCMSRIPASVGLYASLSQVLLYRQILSQCLAVSSHRSMLAEP